MKPIDFRNETFDQIRERLNEDRARVHRAWLAHGPGTTREVAARSGIDLLTLRPRSTELFQLGLLAVQDRAGHEGTYEARPLDAWEQYVVARRAETAASQLHLV